MTLPFIIDRIHLSMIPFERGSVFSKNLFCLIPHFLFVFNILIIIYIDNMKFILEIIKSLVHFKA